MSANHAMSHNHITELSHLRSAVLAGLRAHYLRHSVLEVRAPQLVDITGSCEDTSTLLAVSSTGTQASQQRSLAYPQGYLAQTGQLFLEQALTELGACWCQTTSFRNDPPDTRHLTEFELIEEEFCADLASPILNSNDAALSLFDELLNRIANAVRAAIESAMTNIEQLATSPASIYLRIALEHDYPRVTYDDALQISNIARAAKAEMHGKYLAPLRWGDDLTSADESAVRAALAYEGTERPVFVTLFPAQLKFFNMMEHPQDSHRVLSADLLLPFAGEAVGAAVRENNHIKLQQRLAESQMYKNLLESGLATIQSFMPYINLIRSRSQLHAGYGVGLERLLQYVAGESDIRNMSLSHRLKLAR